MWKPCAANEITKADYIAAATFTADIDVIARSLGTELTVAAEDTGPIDVLALAGPLDQFALLVSHKYGDPSSIEIRLRALKGPQDWVMCETTLNEVIAALSITPQHCTWICPFVVSP